MLGIESNKVLCHQWRIDTKVKGIKVNKCQLVRSFYPLMSCYSLKLSLWSKCIENHVI